MHGECQQKFQNVVCLNLFSDYDSGCPIIIQGDTWQDDRWVASVSWGEECADPDFPAVNARYSSWIDQQVCLHSRYPPKDFDCPMNHQLRLAGVVVFVAFVALIVWIVTLLRKRRGKQRTWITQPTYESIASSEAEE